MDAAAHNWVPILPSYCAGFSDTAALIDKALEAESIAAQSLPGYLRDLESAFDARDAALTRK